MDFEEFWPRYLRAAGYLMAWHVLRGTIGEHYASSEGISDETTA